MNETEANQVEEDLDELLGMNNRIDWSSDHPEVRRVMHMALARVIADGSIEWGSDTSNNSFRASVRLSVARALAAENVVLSPDKWATLVRRTTDFAINVAGAFEVHPEIERLRRDYDAKTLEANRLSERINAMTTGLDAYVKELRAKHDSKDIEIYEVDNGDELETVITFEGFHVNDDHRIVLGRSGTLEIPVCVRVTFEFEDFVGDHDDLVSHARGEMCLTEGSTYDQDGYPVRVDNVDWFNAEERS